MRLPAGRAPWPEGSYQLVMSHAHERLPEPQEVPRSPREVVGARSSPAESSLEFAARFSRLPNCSAFIASVAGWRA